MKGGYQVEDVLKKKVENGQVFYRIKWKGYSSAFNSWEPAKHLSSDLIAYFEEREEEDEIKRQQKEKQKFFRSLQAENRPQQIKIEGHFVNPGKQLVFEVSREGQFKKEEISRSKLLEKDGLQLANYYIELAKKTGHY